MNFWKWTLWRARTMHSCTFRFPICSGSFVVTKSLRTLKLWFADPFWKISFFSGISALQFRALLRSYLHGLCGPRSSKKRASQAFVIDPGIKALCRRSDRPLLGPKLQNSGIQSFWSCRSKKYPFCIGSIIWLSFGSLFRVTGSMDRRVSSLSSWI